MTDVDTLVVGAGPQALTVLARWVCERPDRLQHVRVVDPAGAWLHAWEEQFGRQRIDFLRSPGVHHPDPDEMALLNRYADMDEEAPALAEWDAAWSEHRCCGPLRRPATGVFARFCADLLRHTGLAQRVAPGSVVELTPPGASRAPTWSARLADGATLDARQVVWATNPRRLVVPDGVELGGTVAHGSGVDVKVAAPGERIAVLGGGQTAGQLALTAAQVGAEVILISRGPERVADLDVDAAWLMDDRLVPFRSISDPAARRRVVEAARRGSMTADLVEALHHSSVQWCRNAGELAAWPRHGEAVVRFADVELEVDRVWSATGSVPDLRVEPALDLLAEAGAPHVEGWPVLDASLEWIPGLFVAGALAALTVGPAAGNLGGARAAAERLAGAAPSGAGQVPGCSPPASRNRVMTRCRAQSHTSHRSATGRPSNGVAGR